MSVILSSVSAEVLPIVVDCQTLCSIWQTLENTLVSLSNSRIIQLHGSFQKLWQGNDIVSAYLQQNLSLMN
jgi:hypothetical protein